MKLLRYLTNLLLIPDEAVSAITGGDPRESVSSRLGKAQRGDYGTLYKRLTYPLTFIVNIVFLCITGKKNHCLNNIDDKVGDEAAL